MSNSSTCQIRLLPAFQLDLFQYNPHCNHLLVLTNEQIEPVDAQSCNLYQARSVIRRLSMKYQVQHIVFLSSRDQFKAESLLEELKYFLSNPATEITLLVPYHLPP